MSRAEHRLSGYTLVENAMRPSGVPMNRRSFSHGVEPSAKYGEPGSRKTDLPDQRETITRLENLEVEGTER